MDILRSPSKTSFSGTLGVVCLIVRSLRSLFSMSEDSERKDSFELLILRPIYSEEDSSTIFLESTFLLFFLLPLLLFLTLIESLERVYAPTVSKVSSRFLVALKATGTSALKIVGIFVALKATVDRNVNSHC